MKMVLIIADGLGDVPYPELKNKTPLEYGSYPTLDRMAKEGVNGIMDPISPGIPPGSDTAHIAILGEDPYKYYNGRGYLEALGTGVEPGEHDIGFRLNFATVTKGIIEDRRAGREPYGIDRMVKDINESVTLEVPFVLKAATGTRAALVLNGNNLSSNVSDGDPHEVYEAPREVVPMDKTIEAKFTAEQLNDFIAKTEKLLAQHPVNNEREEKGFLQANYLLARGAGTKPKVPTFQEKYGVEPACIAATALIRGVAKCYGFELLDVPEITGEYDTNVINKANATLKALEDYDFIFTHFKPTDTASHDGDPKKKVEMISKVDVLLSLIVGNVDPSDTIIALTGDHTTPCMAKEHTGEPVPLVLWGSRVRTDDVTNFNERSCAKGGLNRIRGQDLVPIMMNQALRTKLFGA